MIQGGFANLRINGIFGALEYSEGGVFEDGQTQVVQIVILDLYLPVVVETEGSSICHGASPPSF